MTAFVFTFGSGHVHPVTGEDLRNHFVTIEAVNAMEARAEMVRRFGLTWCERYESRADAGVYDFYLIELQGEEAIGLLAARRADA